MRKARPSLLTEGGAYGKPEKLQASRPLGTLRGRFCLMILPCVIGPGNTGAANTASVPKREATRLRESIHQRTPRNSVGQALEHSGLAPDCYLESAGGASHPPICIDSRAVARLQPAFTTRFW